jgi:hypothetical protein
VMRASTFTMSTEFSRDESPLAASSLGDVVSREAFPNAPHCK